MAQYLCHVCDELYGDEFFDKFSARCEECCEGMCDNCIIKSEKQRETTVCEICGKRLWIIHICKRCAECVICKMHVCKQHQYKLKEPHNLDVEGRVCFPCNEKL